MKIWYKHKNTISKKDKKDKIIGNMTKKLKICNKMDKILTNKSKIITVTYVYNAHLVMLY